MTIKTPEQLTEDAARTVLERFDLAAGTVPLTDYAFEMGQAFTYEEGLRAIVEAAIEADRAQTEAQLTWHVLTGGTSRYPLAIIGRYATKLEADAVADAWEDVNGQYGIHYRVKEDV